MATTRSQRIGIWVIAVAMILGTIGGFVAMMVAPGNEAKDQAALEVERKQWNDAITKYQQKVNEQNAEYQKKQDEKAKELGYSDKYYGEFSGYSSRVGEFDAGKVDELKKEDLKVGDGEEIGEDTKVAMYYIGWNPSGKIFDQSVEGESLKTPFAVDGPADANMIVGWKEGLIGMKVGGVRELIIPSDMGYGEQGMGEDIPPNTPLKFVVMAVPSLGIEEPAEIPMPEMPPLVRKEYERHGLY